MSMTTRQPYFTSLPSGKFGIVIPHQEGRFDAPIGSHTGKWVSVRRKDGTVVTRKVGTYLTYAPYGEIYRFDDAKCPACGNFHDHESPPAYAFWCRDCRIHVQNIEDKAAEAGNQDPWGVLCRNTPDGR